MPLPRFSTLVITVLLASGVAPRARAQLGGDGFLFHAPHVRLGLRGGYALANASSDIFQFTTENLTLNKRDFSGVDVGGSVGFSVTDRIELSVDVGYSRAAKGSEFRHLIDNNDLPIEQRTTFERIPYTANAKLYLISPGERIGTTAWIPAKVSPWIGVGGGVMQYRFHQEGDFVDFQTNKVISSVYESSAVTAVVQGLAGADITLKPWIALTADARYLWAKGEPGQDFSGFDKIDLSGVSATVGLSFRL
jgi:hypothetical protein